MNTSLSFSSHSKHLIHSIFEVSGRDGSSFETSAQLSNFETHVKLEGYKELFSPCANLFSALLSFTCLPITDMVPLLKISLTFSLRGLSSRVQYPCRDLSPWHCGHLPVPTSALPPITCLPLSWFLRPPWPTHTQDLLICILFL